LLKNNQYATLAGDVQYFAKYVAFIAYSYNKNAIAAIDKRTNVSWFNTNDNRTNGDFWSRLLPRGDNIYLNRE